MKLLLEDVVYDVLTKKIKARDDDFELVLRVYETLCPDLLEMKLISILSDHKEYGLPSFESITRARRKIQSQHKELISQKTRQKRMKLEREYRDYYSKKEERDFNYEQGTIIRSL